MLEEGGVDRGGVDLHDVDAGVVALQLDAEGLGERLDRVLGRRVAGVKREGALGLDGGDVDDRAAAGGLHDVDRGLRAVDGARGN